jgi:hypothetical protein
MIAPTSRVLRCHRRKLMRLNRQGTDCGCHVSCDTSAIAINRVAQSTARRYFVTGARAKEFLTSNIQRPTSNIEVQAPMGSGHLLAPPGCPEARDENPDQFVGHRRFACLPGAWGGPSAEVRFWMLDVECWKFKKTKRDVRRAGAVNTGCFFCALGKT